MNMNGGLMSRKNRAAVGERAVFGGARVKFTAVG